MIAPLLNVLADIESTQSVEDPFALAKHAIDVSASPAHTLVAIVAIFMVFLVPIAFFAAIAFIVWTKGKRREKLALAAIENHQPEIAKELARPRFTAVAWIVGGIVTIVAIDQFRWYQLIVTAFLVAACFFFYTYMKSRKNGNGFSNGRGSNGAQQYLPKQDVAAPQAQDPANRPAGQNQAL